MQSKTYLARGNKLCILVKKIRGYKKHNWNKQKSKTAYLMSATLCNDSAVLVRGKPSEKRGAQRECLRNSTSSDYGSVFCSSMTTLMNNCSREKRLMFHKFSSNSGACNLFSFVQTSNLHTAGTHISTVSYISLPEEVFFFPNDKILNDLSTTKQNICAPHKLNRFPSACLTHNNVGVLFSYLHSKSPQYEHYVTDAQ